MPIAVKPVAKVVDKWAARAGAAQPDYVFGVQNPRRPQGATAAAAAPTWAAGVQAAVTAGTYAKHVAAADAKWSRNAQGKGATRFVAGVTSAKPDFEAKIAKVLQVISGLTISPNRMPKGDPANPQRSAFVAAALHAAKIAGTFSGS